MYVAVADVQTAKKVKEISLGARASAHGVSGDLHLVWDITELKNKSKGTVPVGTTGFFDIAGDYGLVWISEDRNFAVDRTPFCSTRVHKGEVKCIRDEHFPPDNDDGGEPVKRGRRNSKFMERPIGECRLLDVPGIGPAGERKLLDARCESPLQLLQKFTSLGCSESETVAWLRSIGFHDNHAHMVAAALKDKAAQMGPAGAPT